MPASIAACMNQIEPSQEGSIGNGVISIVILNLFTFSQIDLSHVLVIHMFTTHRILAGAEKKCPTQWGWAPLWLAFESQYQIDTHSERGVSLSLCTRLLPGKGIKIHRTRNPNVGEDTPPLGISCQYSLLRLCFSLSQEAALLQIPCPRGGQNWRLTINHTLWQLSLPEFTQSAHSWSCCCIHSNAVALLPVGHVINPKTKIFTVLETGRCSISAKLPSANGTPIERLGRKTLFSYIQVPSAFYWSDIR